MEYYHYVNIFETKGLEYILVICFMITFVLFVRRLDMPLKNRKPGSLSGPPAAVINGKVIVVPEEDDHAGFKTPEQGPGNDGPRDSGPPDS